MNIFTIDRNPVIAAQSLCDKHVVKMVVESAQMLSTAHRVLDGALKNDHPKRWELPDDRENVLYKATHVSHPCTVWTMKSNNNYTWHWVYFAALCDEYTYRYNKIHATDKLLREKLMSLPNNIEIGSLTQRPIVMNSNPECIHLNDTVRSYRELYQLKQSQFNMTWTNREIPEWLKDLNTHGVKRDKLKGKMTNLIKSGTHEDVVEVVKILVKHF